MEIRFLGGAGEIGRSAVLIDDSLLLDFGMTTDNPPSLPVGSGPGGAVDPDAVVVSHGHLDHAGAVPALLSGDSRPPIHWTPPTEQLALTLARDTLKLHGGTYRCPFTRAEVARVTEVSERHGYGEPFEAAGYEVTLFDAGHVPGSAHVLVDDSEVRRTSGRRTRSDDGATRLLYTGDFHTDDQRLLAGTTARPDADVVVTESTYADVTHTDRETLEERFAERVRTTRWEGGSVVVPAFAVGRTQEMLMVCERHGIDCYVDGMGQSVTRMLRDYPQFLRDPAAFRRAVSHARFVTGGDGQRRRIVDEGAVVVTTSGMLTGGPAMTYVPAVRESPTNLVAFTGFQVPGTPGRELLDTGSAELDGRMQSVAARCAAFDFSAHADADGLRAFLDDYREARTLVVHGDDCDRFAASLRADGVDASAPAVGDAVTV